MPTQLVTDLLQVGLDFPCVPSLRVVLICLFRGQILHTLGDELSFELGTCLPIFLERLRNEITRLTTVKAVTLIAG